MSEEEYRLKNALSTMTKDYLDAKDKINYLNIVIKSLEGNVKYLENYLEEVERRVNL